MKLQELGLTGRSPALEDDAEGVPNPSAVDSQTGQTLRRKGAKNFVGAQFVPKEITKLCMRCTATFGQARAQLHCRQCGLVLCPDCCHQRRRVSELGEHAVLVCEDCVPRLDAAAGAAPAQSQVAQTVEELNISVAPLSPDSSDDNGAEQEVADTTKTNHDDAAAIDAAFDDEPPPAFQEASPVLQDITDVRAHVLRLLQPVGTSGGVPIDGFDVEYDYMGDAQREALEALDFASAVAEPNLQKNRYSNILPPEHSRVRLAVRDGDDAHADYINANVLNGEAAGTEGRYITCQGPLETTFTDFWRMVWEQNASVVLMLTREIEKGFVKCDRYWPEPGGGAEIEGAAAAPLDVADDGAVSSRYGDVRVTHVGVELGDEYLVRRFEVEYDGEKRVVVQYQYTGWPDHGIPASRAGFLQLVALADLANVSKGPLIVHCFRADDHQLLTDRGFRALDELDGTELVASYDPITAQLVYAKPRSLIVNERTPLDELLELRADDADVSIVATSQHDMYASSSASRMYHKRQLRDVRANCDRLLTVAVNGVKLSDDNGDEEFDLEAYGAALTNGDGEMESENLAPWIWRLSRAQLRVVVRGFASGGNCVDVKSISLRDDLVRLLLHAGYSPMFEQQQSTFWRVMFADVVDEKRTQPIVSAVAPILRDGAKATCRTWCFDMNGGFVVARRVVKDAAGVVIGASRPVISGNCSAGVGRTGTYCAVHSALESFMAQLNAGATQPSVNIMRSVLDMRSRRPGMVQTKEQYIFCYLAVLEQTEQWLFERGLLAPAADNANTNNTEEETDAAESLE